jgi:ribonuclease-3
VTHALNFTLHLVHSASKALILHDNDAGILRGSLGLPALPRRALVEGAIQRPPRVVPQPGSLSVTLMFVTLLYVFCSGACDNVSPMRAAGLMQCSGPTGRFGVRPDSDEFDVSAAEGTSRCFELAFVEARELSAAGVDGGVLPLPLAAAESRLRVRLGHTFQRESLLDYALTFPAWRKEHPGTPVDNQRLQFLGARALELALGEVLLHALPRGHEGDLGTLQQELVRERTLAGVGMALDLGPALRLGKSDDARGSRQQASVLAAGVLALAGAVFLDGGYRSVRKVAIQWLGAHVDALVARLRVADQRSPSGVFEAAENWKSALQVRLRELGMPLPSYSLIAESGPAHARRFRVQVAADVGGQTWVAVGEAASKRTAENAAAGRLLRDLAELG